MESGLSFLNMAEAMLENDDYKSSHENLREYGNDEEAKLAADSKNSDQQQEEPPTEKRLDRVSRSSSFLSDKNRSDSRSVVIQEPPPKRRKISTPFTPKDIVDALNASISMEERLDAIYKAASTFDHEDRDLHSLEIQAGADIALVKMLAFLEFKTGFRRPPIKANLDAITKEISLVCQTLEMIYRTTSESVELSFNRVGIDLLQIIVILIDEEVNARLQRLSQELSPASTSTAPQPSTDLTGDREDYLDGQRSVTPPPQFTSWCIGDWDRDLMLRKASKILGHFARVGSATRDVAHFPGLLGSILNLINMRPYDAVPWEARLSCLWTIANLACNSENMMMMICTPGLVNSLVNVGFRQVEPMEPLERTMEVLRARSIASRAILNLSWPVENKILLAENAALLDMLCQLAVKRTPPYAKSKTMHEILAQSRQYAVGGLRSLAAAPRRTKIFVCEYANGKILDVLTDVVLNETEESIVELALAAIHNLASYDTAEIIASKPDLVLALKSHLVSESAQEDEPNKPKSHASSTLLVLERSITPEMPLYENLKELLEADNPTNKDEGKSQTSEDPRRPDEIVAV